MGTAGVLVVDDDEAIREALSEVLEEEGFSVALAKDGRDALGYLASHELPCVIVLDLMMPVMSGPEFREKQLADPKIAQIPVIVMSASDIGRTVAHGLRANAFLSKPPSMDNLVQTLQRYC